MGSIEVVRINAKGDAHKVASLSKLAGDQVIWVSEGKRPITVKFPQNGSPFRKETFTIDAEGATISGPVKDGAEAARKYHYVVEMAAAKGDDGDVVINP